MKLTELDNELGELLMTQKGATYDSKTILNLNNTKFAYPNNIFIFIVIA